MKLPVLTYSKDCMQPVDHVPELFLFISSESSIIISSDQFLHLSSLKIRNLECVAKSLLLIYQTRPVKQVNQTEIICKFRFILFNISNSPLIVSDHLIQEFLDISILIHVSLFESLLESGFVNFSLDDHTLLAGNLGIISSCSLNTL